MGRWSRARAGAGWAAAGLGAALAGTGCAYSMIVDGALRRDVLADITARAALARGIPAPGSVPARVIEREALPEVVRAALAYAWTQAELDQYQESLVTAGVWPPDRDLVEEFVALGSEQIAGLYAPEDRVLYVVADARRPLLLRLVSRLLGRDLFLEFALSHEIVHWLQHQAYPWLLEEDETWKWQDDYTLAIQTAVEGDALRYGMEALFAERARLPAPDDLAEDTSEALDSNAPALLRLTLLLPYVEGYRLSYAEGPALLDAPPASTEQALHPERRREPFTVADLAAARRALPEGCRVVAQNTLGEAEISVLFRDLAPEPRPEAWQGWNGDRYLAARCGETRELAWWTSWDDEADAHEFAEAYAEIAEAVRRRAGFPDPPHVWQKGTTVVVTTPAFGDPDAWLPDLRTGRVATGPALRRFFGAPYVHPDAPTP